MIDLGKTTIGQAAERGQPLQVPDMADAHDHPFREFSLKAGIPVRAHSPHDEATG